VYQKNVRFVLKRIDESLKIDSQEKNNSNNNKEKKSNKQTNDLSQSQTDVLLES